MAKFAVGEIALHVGQCGIECLGWGAGERIRVIGVGPFKKGDEVDGLILSYDCEYVVEDEASARYWAEANEKHLRKLPPDDNQAATRDATEEPGLTRLKKLLEQDTVPQKRTRRERA